MVRDRRIIRHTLLEDEGPTDRLTERELEVLALVAGGKSNKEIARALNITVHTAKAHTSRILHKLGVESRVEAVVLYIKRRK